MIEALTKTVNILLIEDNEGDVILTNEAFKTSKIANEILVARDGEEAMDFLHKKEEFSNVPTPDLILLDLNLPKKDGKQVLKEIKENDQLKKIPVLILTSSKAEKDVIKSYSLHANSYITKPVDLSKFTEIIKAIEDFWFSAAVLPNNK